MALDRATTIGEPAETLVAPFERKGGIRHEAGVSIGRYQIFPNTRCLSGVKCLSDESCSSVDTQVSRGGEARDHRRVAMASLAKSGGPRACFEELAHDEEGPSVNVGLFSTYNLEPVSAVMQFVLNCIPSQAHLRRAPLAP